MECSRGRPGASNLHRDGSSVTFCLLPPGTTDRNRYNWSWCTFPVIYVIVNLTSNFLKQKGRFCVIILTCTGHESSCEVYLRYSVSLTGFPTTSFHCLLLLYFHTFLLLYICSQYCFRHLSKILKSDISFVVSVRLSVPTEQLGSRWEDLHEIFCYSWPRKFKYS